MKNLLILIVAIAVYLHFYPNAEVTKFYNDKIGLLQGGFAEFSDTKVRLKSDIIYTKLKSDLAGFSEEEVSHLKELTSSRDKVKAFYFSICQTDQRDVIFHQKNETKVCAVIQRYTSMF